MQNRLLLKIFLTSSLFLFNLSLEAQSYEIKIQIKGAGNKELMLAYYLGQNRYIEQKGRLDKKGKAVFKANKILPAGIYSIMLDNKRAFDFLIKNESHFSLSTDTTDYIGRMKVSGSKENKLFFTYQDKVNKLKNKQLTINSKIKATKNKDSLGILNGKRKELEKQLNDSYLQVRKEHPNSYLAKILTAFNSTSVGTFNFADPELIRTPIYYTMLRLFIKKNINKPSSYIIFETRKLLDSLKPVKANYEYTANYLLNFYNSFYKVGINEVFVFIADNYFLPGKANWLNKEQLRQIARRRSLLSQSLPGEKAPNLKLPDITGEYFSLEQMDTKYTLLYFWSANCGHCTKATKELKKAYPKLQEKNIEIFAVNIDKDTTIWQKKIEEMDLQWINLQDINEVSNYREKYYVYGSPLLYLIDNKHIILSKQNGEVEIKQLVEKLIK